MIVFQDEENVAVTVFATHVGEGTVTLSVSDHHKVMLIQAGFVPVLKAAFYPNSSLACAWGKGSSKYETMARGVLQCVRYP